MSIVLSLFHCGFVCIWFLRQFLALTHILKAPEIYPRHKYQFKGDTFIHTLVGVEVGLENRLGS